MNKPVNFFQPLTFEDFISEYFDKKHLFLHRNENFNDPILSENDLNTFLSRNDLTPNHINLVKNGKDIDKKHYTEMTNSAQYIVPKRLMSMFNSGASMIIYSGHRFFPNLSDFCLQLSTLFKFYVQANIYITPPQSVGLNAHWDTHDVIVLQVAGSKKWEIYNSLISLPTKESKFHPQKLGLNKFLNKEIPIQTDQLTKGDFLYLPRGVIHSVQTTNDYSVHITIGILSYTWDDFFRFYIKNLNDDKDFRRAVPLWDKNAMQNEFDNISNKITTTFREQIYKDKTFDELQINASKGMLTNNNNLFQKALKINSITDKTIISIDGTESMLVTVYENELKIKFKEKEVAYPAFLKDAFEYMNIKKIFKISELPVLDNEKRISLVKRLLEIDFLKLE